MHNSIQTNTQKTANVNSPVKENPSKPMHWWRIHRRVSRRLWLELDQWLRDIIAGDTAHTTSQFKWFQTKVEVDTNRLFEDPEYYDNLPETFQYAK